MDRQEHRQKLLAFLDSVAKPGCSAGEIDDDDMNLVQAGVLDSFALIQIIFYLEQNYGVNLQKLGIDPADLVSIGGMMSALEHEFD